MGQAYSKQIYQTQNNTLQNILYKREYVIQNIAYCILRFSRIKNKIWNSGFGNTYKSYINSLFKIQR